MNGSLVRPQDITASALLTVEGELDDISGAGQTRAATSSVHRHPKAHQKHFDALGAGHYGIFSAAAGARTSTRWCANSSPNTTPPAGIPGPRATRASCGEDRDKARRQSRTARAPRQGVKVPADQIDDALPQTQCTRCGYADCRAYAEAMADGEAGINQCPPGGAEGIVAWRPDRARPVIPLSPEHGQKTPRSLAVIDEAWCIGCTLCIKACPVDAIVGAPKLMHWVVNAQCTGCELCVPACPVDCIQMRPETTTTGWPPGAPQADGRHRSATASAPIRRHRETEENEARLAAKARAKLADLPATTRTPKEPSWRKRAVIEAALARAQAKRGA